MKLYKNRLWYIWKDLTEPVDGSTPIQEWPSQIFLDIKKKLDQVKAKIIKPKPIEIEEIDDEDFDIEITTINEPVKLPSKEELIKQDPIRFDPQCPYTVTRHYHDSKLMQQQILDKTQRGK